MSDGDKAALRAKLEAFFKQHAPADLSKIDAAMKMSISEDELFKKLRKKYKVPEGGEGGDTAKPATEEATVAKDAPTTKETAPAADESSGSNKDALRKRLEEFYQKHAPEEMSKIDVALKMKIGEEELFAKLYKKYKIEPPTPTAAGAAAEAKPDVVKPAEEKPAKEEAKASAPVEAVKSSDGDDSSNKDALRKRLEEFYQKHAPEEMSKIDVALKMKIGEEELFAKLYKKYKVEPPTPAAAGAAAEAKPEVVKPVEEKPAKEEAKPSAPVEAVKSSDEDDSSNKDALRKRLEEFYQKHAPEEMSKIDAALKMKIGEEELFAKLYKKYKVEPPAAGNEAKPEEVKKMVPDTTAKPQQPLQPQPSSFSAASSPLTKGFPSIVREEPPQEESSSSPPPPAAAARRPLVSPPASAAPSTTDTQSTNNQFEVKVTEVAAAPSPIHHAVPTTAAPSPITAAAPPMMTTTTAGGMVSKTDSGFAQFMHPAATSAVPADVAIPNSAQATSTSLAIGNNLNNSNNQSNNCGGGTVSIRVAVGTGPAVRNHLAHSLSPAQRREWVRCLAIDLRAALQRVSTHSTTSGYGIGVAGTGGGSPTSMLAQLVASDLFEGQPTNSNHYPSQASTSSGTCAGVVFHWVLQFATAAAASACLATLAGASTALWSDVSGSMGAGGIATSTASTTGLLHNSPPRGGNGFRLSATPSAASRAAFSPTARMGTTNHDFSTSPSATSDAQMLQFATSPVAGAARHHAASSTGVVVHTPQARFFYAETGGRPSDLPFVILQAASASPPPHMMTTTTNQSMMNLQQHAHHPQQPSSHYDALSPAPSSSSGAGATGGYGSPLLAQLAAQNAALAARAEAYADGRRRVVAGGGGGDTTTSTMTMASSNTPPQQQSRIAIGQYLSSGGAGAMGTGGGGMLPLSSLFHDPQQQGNVLLAEQRGLIVGMQAQQHEQSLRIQALMDEQLRRMEVVERREELLRAREREVEEEALALKQKALQSSNSDDRRRTLEQQAHRLEQRLEALTTENEVLKLRLHNVSAAAHANSNPNHNINSSLLNNGSGIGGGGGGMSVSAMREQLLSEREATVAGRLGDVLQREAALSEAQDRHRKGVYAAYSDRVGQMVGAGAGVAAAAATTAGGGGSTLGSTSGRYRSADQASDLLAAYQPSSSHPSYSQSQQQPAWWVPRTAAATTPPAHAAATTGAAGSSPYNNNNNASSASRNFFSSGASPSSVGGSASRNIYRDYY